jgi:hypothetical protein
LKMLDYYHTRFWKTTLSAVITQQKPLDSKKGNDNTPTVYNKT